MVRLGNHNPSTLGSFSFSDSCCEDLFVGNGLEIGGSWYGMYVNWVVVVVVGSLLSMVVSGLKNLGCVSRDVGLDFVDRVFYLSTVLCAVLKEGGDVLCKGGRVG
jgi:hypothetical protein